MMIEMSAKEVAGQSLTILFCVFLLMLFPLVDIRMGSIGFRTIILSLLGIGLSLLPIWLMKTANAYDPQIAFASYGFAAISLFVLLSALFFAWLYAEDNKR
jgi:hypothetical protein